MSSYDHSVGHINAITATLMLKEILNVGKSQNDQAESQPTCFNGAMESRNSRGTEDNKMLEALLKSSSMTRLKQQVVLQRNDDQHSFGIYGQDVTVVVSPSKHTSGSSKVRIKNIVNYGWEMKYYRGRIVAVHMSGTYIAFGLKIRESPTGMVRVVNRKTSKRMLLKGMKGHVKDLAFAHIPHQVVLACVDSVGTLFVYRIQEEEDDELTCQSILQVEQAEETQPSDYHRVIWCPYIPDDPGLEDNSDSLDSDDASKLLAVTHDDHAEMLNIDLVVRKYGAGPLKASDIHSGYQIISNYTQPIIDAAFSPDGAAMATASLDGEVNFFQVYMLDKNSSPRCLHQWKPHDGKPLSCLFFLDNHKNPNPEVHLWKFAITGADNNRELKVWSCESWNCLQTIRFELPSDETVEPCIKAELDLSASYLLLSDINHRVLYILQVHQDREQSMASICSISEFPLKYPMLSFAIVDASRKKYKESMENDNVLDDGGFGDTILEDDELQDSNGYVDGVVARLYLVQPMSLQECRIAFQPVSSISLPSTSLSSLSQDSLAFRDRLSDLSFDAVNSELEVKHDESALRSSLSNQTGMSGGQLLLTPDAFTSPSHSTCKPHSESSSIATTFPNGTPTSVPLPPVTPSEEAALASPHLEEAPLATSEIIDSELRRSGRSSGSSPSLEVQQILAPHKQVLDLDIKADVDDAEVIEGPVEVVADHTLKSTESCLPTTEVSSLTPQQPEHLASLTNLPPISKPALSSGSSERNQREYDTTIWPIAPNLNSEMKVVSLEQLAQDRQEVQLAGAGEHRTKVQSLNELYHSEKRIEQVVETLQSKVQTILSAMQTQQDTLVKIQQKLHRQNLFLSNINELEQQLSKVESSVKSIVDTSLSQSGSNDYKRLEDLLRNQQERENQRQEQLLAVISQTINNTVSSKLETIVATEIRDSVLPYIDKVLNPVKDQLQLEVAQKLTATDTVIKDNINKLVKSKSTVESIGAATASALQGPIQAAYREAFQGHALPAFEKACQNLFTQINDSFQRGTKEYIQQLESHLERYRHQNEQIRDPVLTRLQSVLENIQTSSETIGPSIISTVQEELERQLQENLSSIQTVLVQHIHTVVKDEITSAMEKHQNQIGDSVLNAIRSRAVTPVPSIEAQQAQVVQLLRQGQINAAFQQALSASDLNLVVFICETVNPSQVFNQTPCPLQQPVLLSLIQQLSADLFTHTELKYKYLEEAVLNLDPDNPITQEYMASVMGTLRQKLQQYLQKEPKSKLVRNIKMLLMAVQSLLKEPS